MKIEIKKKDLLVLAAALAVAFTSVVVVQRVTGRIDGVAMLIFLLAVFVTSMYTEGYFCGVLASLISVLAVNFAFFTPYFAFNFTLPENLFSGLVMLAVSIMTSALTTRVKRQEQLRTGTSGYRFRNFTSTASSSSSSTVGVFFKVTCWPSMRVTDSRFSTIRFSHWASSQASPSSFITWSFPRES